MGKEACCSYTKRSRIHEKEACFHGKRSPNMGIEACSSKKRNQRIKFSVERWEMGYPTNWIKLNGEVHYIHSTSYKTHHCFQTCPHLSIVWNSITSLGNSLVRVAARDKKEKGHIQKYKPSKITFSIFLLKKVKKLFSHSTKGQKTTFFYN